MQEKNPSVQIIRGLPGSGKTTLAIDKYPFLLRLETDMFFYRKGAYRFTMENNRRAVGWFLKEVGSLCRRGMDFVVTGVFSAHTERLGSVIETARKHGYDVWIKTLTSNYGSIHAVHKEHFLSMKDSFVADKELRKTFANDKSVHFGLMGSDYPLAHLKI